MSIPYDPLKRTQIEGVDYTGLPIAGVGASISDIYGTSWAKDILDGLNVVMTELRDTLTSYNYKFSYVHNRHNVAALFLNAVTINIDNISTSGEYAGISAGTVTDYIELQCSIRLHTAYVGARFSPVETTYLINSIINKLLDNRDFGNNLDVVNIRSSDIGAEFNNFTKGAEISFTVAVPVDHIQED